MDTVSRGNMWSHVKIVVIWQFVAVIHVKIHDWLLLIDTPEGTTLSTSAAFNTVAQGGSVTFTCNATAANPQVSRYKFYLNDTTLVKHTSDNQYTIHNVQRSQHYGKYKCVPRNDVGDGPEAIVTLNVNSELHHCLVNVCFGIRFIKYEHLFIIHVCSFVIHVVNVDESMWG